VIHCKRDVAGQLGQQLHFFFDEEAGLGGVERERAQFAVRGDQRQYGHRTDSGSGVNLAEHDDRIVLRIV
jgi:hypothetical protein